MRINSGTAILRKRLLLVPYVERHVPKYHQWMQVEDLRTATASEPLSLEEEYAMQRSWRLDHDKLTFILCAVPDQDVLENKGVDLKAGEYDNDDTMIGDVNMFLTADDDECGESPSGEAVKLVGEIEIMIAETQQRGNRMGTTALSAFVQYIVLHRGAIVREYASEMTGSIAVKLGSLRAKIDQNNTASIRLFQSQGFKLVSTEPNFFGEVELRWDAWDCATQISCLTYKNAD